MEKAKRINTNKAFRLLWRFLVRQKRKIAAGIIATIMIGVMELLTGAFLKFLTNTITKIEGINSSGGELKIPLKLNIDLEFIGENLSLIDKTLKGNQEIFKGVVVVSVVFLILYLLQALFQYAREVYMNLAIERVLQDFKSQIFAKLLNSPLRNRGNNETGDTISRVTYDVAVLTDTINILVEISRTFIYIVMFVPVMFIINPRFALITILFFPLSFIIIRYVARIIKKSSLDVSDNVGDYTSFLEQRINRLRMIRIFNTEDKEKMRFDRLVDDNYNYRRRLILQRFFLKPSNEFMGMIVLAILFIFFSKYLLAGESNLGDIAFFLYLVKTSFKPVKKVAQAVGDLNMALISTGKIERIFEEESDTTGGDVSLNGMKIDTVRINNLSFAYNGTPVLKDLSLALGKGMRVAVTGETGAGKTTLCSVLGLLHEASPGSIFLNNTDITLIKREEFRKEVILVDGEMPLMPGTVFQNVAYGTDAEESGISKYMGFLPESVKATPDLVVDGNGRSVTSGEARKIALIRALLRNPSLLILDEAFNFMDEEDIDEAFKLIPKDTIVLFVTRSTKALQHADKVFSLRDGKLTSV